MRLTVGELKKHIEELGISDDDEIWIEYPHLIATPYETCTEFKTCPVEGQTLYISTSTLGYDKEKKRFYIYHHY